MDNNLLMRLTVLDVEPNRYAIAFGYFIALAFGG
jgi:hypothetical protein